MPPWYRIIWLSVALWLGLGATAKLIAVACTIAPSTLWIDSPWMIALLASGEFLLASSLVRITPERWVIWATALLLSGFACIHAAAWLQVLPRCGCFGALTVPSPLMMGLNALVESQNSGRQNLKTLAGCWG